MRSWLSSAAWWDGTAWACSACSACQGSPRTSKESCWTALPGRSRNDTCQAGTPCGNLSPALTAPCPQRHAGKLPGHQKRAEGCGQRVHKLCVSSWAGAVAPCTTGGCVGLSSAPLSSPHCIPSTFPSTHGVPLAPEEGRLSQPLQVLKQQDRPARKMCL